MKNNFAFVNCATREHAVVGKAFVDRHFAIYVNGLPLRVRYDPERTELVPLFPAPTGPLAPSKNLYVSGLSPLATTEALGELFRYVTGP